ncbi:D-glycero-beta-D-manno-heptose 1-phosphate adenylyltransferase [Nocardia elegans]|uniref:D-glycero-beta-D-manno-heptose 1-phosphate adenylyltransferase n=1 Tax=Nocardia elegans TaxID=300029 RepID=UPI002B4B7B2A|nr:D-glycero-beta-D-manno-heptose 1-phosphate adenylyltransferase [Nocardia elegans]
MTSVEPPEHVRATFGLREVTPSYLGDWDGGWRCGDVVLSPVADHARAAWSARVRETLRVDGVRLARPVRATDGRYVVSGWRADTYLAGSPEPRHDEVVSVSLRLHQATARLERPRFLVQPPIAPWVDVDIFVAADRAAWESVPLRSLRAGGAVLSRAAFVEVVRRHRAEGRRVVFTNGCFDVLHAGHIAYLNEAKRLGDVLVVAVNSDSSVRALKGPDRPVNPDHDRCAVLAALSCVDHVTVFEEDTPVELLRATEPDLYVKGGDYRPEMLPETPVVREYGGEVRVLTYLADHSTSAVIERIRSRVTAGR